MFGIVKPIGVVMAASVLFVADATLQTEVEPMKSLTPIIFVDRVEPCLGFWEQLGFEKTGEVPGDDGLVFAMLASGGVEVMYQLRASLKDDLPVLADLSFGPSNFFIKVNDLAAVQSKLEGAEILLDERKTFYGATETVVRAPCGSIITFAQFDEE